MVYYTGDLHGDLRELTRFERLHLTAADIVIHYDPWWNVAAQNQATDRAHRIGQENQVTVFKLITKGTVEENILNLQEMKRELAESVVSEG